MSGLLFEDAQPAATSSANRADIVCFIGFVRRRTGTVLPASLKSWLQDQGWRPLGTPVDDFDQLVDVPVPVESFEAFDALFDWEQRPTASKYAFPFCTWMGAAVRSFFRQGGARCHIVRTGDPAAYAVLTENASPAEKDALFNKQSSALGKLMPGHIGATTPPSRNEPSTWKGIGVLHGLAEAAFVCLPDLPELVADAAIEPSGLPGLPPAPEEFVENVPVVEPPEPDVRQISSSPACTESGYLRWRAAAQHAARFVAQHRRDVQLLLTLPLPSRNLAFNLTRDLDLDNQLGLGRDQILDEPAGIATAFLQLAYPWLSTPGSEALPGGIEPPDGVYSGVLARSIPHLGVAHSIGRQPLRSVNGFHPALSSADLILDTPKGKSPALIHRVSLLGPTPDGPRVLSDVTTSPSETQRPAPIGRLTAAILRTARTLGDSVAFEPSGEALWSKIRARLTRLLSDFYAAGALQGASAEDAYSVRCDATTTTQNDLDSGRVVAEVRFAPTHPVGLITVVLSLRDGSVTAAGTAA